MIRRERKLRLSPLAQRAYSLPLASRRDINRQIRLRVVREFNLPDTIAEELESAAYQFAEEADESQEHQMQQMQQQATSALIWEPRKSNPVAVRVPVPPKRMTSRQKTFQKSEPVLDLPMDDDNHQLQQSQLSEFIPDIAALSINPMPHYVPSLQPPEPYRYIPPNVFVIECFTYIFIVFFYFQRTSIGFRRWCQFFSVEQCGMVHRQIGSQSIYWPGF